MLTTYGLRGAFLMLALSCASPAAQSTQATAAANRVLVVVNDQSEISGQIAEYYMRRRAIPAANSCVISASPGERVARRVYEDEIETAIGHCLGRGDARDRIDYIVTTKGVPLAISGGGGRDADKAAVDSELTLLYGKLTGESHRLTGHLPNPFFRHHADRFDKAKFPIYLVTRLTGYTLDDVRAIIDQVARSAQPRPLRSR